MRKWMFWLICTMLIAVAAQAGTVAPDLQATLLNKAPNADVAVIIKFLDTLDVTEYRDPNLRRRRANLITDLKLKADQVQQPVRARLTSSRAKRLRRLWLTNDLAAIVRAGLVAELARHPSVESVRLDAQMTRPPGSLEPQPLAGWNLTAIGAPALWALGFTGQGAVVATMDTGVDPDHLALGPTWRGGTNSWFDPHPPDPLDPLTQEPHLTPIDLAGHGTQTMGTIVAGEVFVPVPEPGGVQAIGVAPGAQWIAVKMFNDAGVASFSDVHLGFQWILNPDGDSTTDDTPDIVNNSWGFRIPECDPEFQPDIDALRAAGIAVVFAAGNSGPLAQSGLSPANNSGSLAVGAVDETLTIAPDSSRGPSACDGGIFPTVVAPGVNVVTTDLSFGGIIPDATVMATGTSVAAPHVAGGIALLKSAFPNRSLADVESAIIETAQDLGVSGPDNEYGAGLINLVAAYEWLRTHIPSTDTVEIIKTRYHAKQRQLVVKAASDAAPDVTLTLPEYGNVAMVYKARKGIYEKVVNNVLAKPATVTVVSSGGGSDTKPVPFPKGVTILETRYMKNTKELLVIAISDAQPEAILRLPRYGNVHMQYDASKGYYHIVVQNVRKAPKFVTVVSNGKGRDTRPVPYIANR